MAKMKAGFDHGEKRRANPDYAAAYLAVPPSSAEIDVSALERGRKPRSASCHEADQGHRKERRMIPSVDPMDSDFRRLRYCRYADDFLSA